MTTDTDKRVADLEKRVADLERQLVQVRSVLSGFLPVIEVPQAPLPPQRPHYYPPQIQNLAIHGTYCGDHRPLD